MTKKAIIQIDSLEKGQKISGCLLLTENQLATTKTGSSYLKNKLTDGGSTISWNLWDANPSDVQKFKDCSILYFTDATVSEYNGSTQLNADQTHVTVLYESDFNKFGLSGIEDFTKVVIPIDKLRQKVLELISLIKDEDLRKLVTFIIDSTNGAYYKQPAAQNIHHAFTGGLATHSISIAYDLIDQANRYNSLNEYRGGRKINQDLLISAALIHDIGKIYEMTPAPSTQYTLLGHLFGHIIIGNDIIIKAATKLGIPSGCEKLVLLEHMVLSHHGKLEWGSPVAPQTLEAIMLHQADQTDAKIENATENVDKLEKGESSPNKVFGLDNVHIYRPKNDFK